MSSLYCRSSIVGAAVVLALLSSRPAEAQVIVDPGPPPPRHPGGVVNSVVTGVYYDIINKELAEKHLLKLQAKLRRDAERGDTAAVDHDLRRMDNLKYRITIDEWLIRWNSLQEPGFYPIRTDPVSCIAIAEAGSQTQGPDPLWPAPRQGPMVPAPTIPITIVNAELTGPGVAFTINGMAHQATAGSRQDLAVAPGSSITYDGGGSLGQRRYRLSQGQYEFRSTAQGWALYQIRP